MNSFIIIFTIYFNNYSRSSMINSTTIPENQIISYINEIYQNHTLFNPILCDKNSDCQRISGNNSRCYSGGCICDLGYIDQLGQCTKMRCHTHADCYRNLHGTQCEEHACVCDYGYSIDRYSQTCRFSKAEKMESFGFKWILFLSCFVIFGSI